MEAKPQDDPKATYTRPIAKDDLVIDWAVRALDIWHRVRAYSPRPGARTSWKGDQLKVLRARPLSDWSGQGTPGQVLQESSAAAVICGEGALLLEEVQLAGKRVMGIEDFLRGQRDFVGSRLGQ